MYCTGETYDLYCTGGKYILCCNWQTWHVLQRSDVTRITNSWNVLQRINIWHVLQRVNINDKYWKGQTYGMICIAEDKHMTCIAKDKHIIWHVLQRANICRSTFKMYIANGFIKQTDDNKNQPKNCKKKQKKPSTNFLFSRPIVGDKSYMIYVQVVLSINKVYCLSYNVQDRKQNMNILKNYH